IVILKMIQVDHYKNTTEYGFIDLLNKIEPYYILTIIIVGLFGNSLSFFLFMFTKLKLEQANYILAALAFADNGFLISLLMVNLKNFLDLNIFDNSQIGCKISVYITYLFSFLSSWYVVTFSIERLIAVYLPIKRINICNKYTNKLSIFILTLASMSIYSFSLFTSGLEFSSDNTTKSCVTLTKWFNIVQLMAFIDTFLTMIIPFLIIFISNISIVWKLMDFKSPFNFFTSSASTDRSESAVITPKNMKKKNNRVPSREKNDSINDENFYRQIQQMDDSLTRKLFKKISIVNHLPKTVEIRRLQKYSRTTRMLLIVSTTFLILHIPIAICKAWYFIKSYIRQTKNDSSIHLETSSSEEILERLSCYIYYLNFSSNFFLYTLNGPKFRKAIRNLLKIKQNSHHNKILKTKSTII
ncbi:unnamed protein product, partial [Brachionus calyciflorus]